MSYIDLHTVLRDWPYEPEQISVRKILGMDGAVRIQMRVELGVLQLEAEGRPDGLTPHGCESLLVYHLKKVTEYEERSGTQSGFHLDPEECHELRRETSLYYRRYVAQFVLEEYSSVYRDTSHNLGVFDLCRDHAMEVADRTALEGFRPYVLMMDARARAEDAMQEGEPASALAHVNRGIMHIRTYLEQQGRTEAIEESEEMKVLQSLGVELGAKMPKDSLIVTRRALRDAIEQERFEEAAKLRDALKNLHQQEP